MTYKISKSNTEWKEELTDDQYYVCREKGTEPPFTGVYWNSKESGTYNCSCCNVKLFSSDTKFDSGSGWPSFYKPIDEDNIEYVKDYQFGMTRIEVNCKNCGAHLGHVFDDGPMPTNLRYCINSISLDLNKS